VSIQATLSTDAPATCSGVIALVSAPGRAGPKSVAIIEAPPADGQWQLVSTAGIDSVHAGTLYDSRGPDHTSFSFNVTWQQPVDHSLTITLLGINVAAPSNPNPTRGSSVALAVSCSHPFTVEAPVISHHFLLFDDSGLSDGYGLQASPVASAQILNHATWSSDGPTVEAYLGALPGGKGNVTITSPQGRQTVDVGVARKTLTRFSLDPGPLAIDLSTVGPQGFYWGAIVDEARKP
jgi:hypothetical protein